MTLKMRALQTILHVALEFARKTWGHYIPKNILSFSIIVHKQLKILHYLSYFSISFIVAKNENIM
jgi:hypothetical protein